MSAEKVGEGPEMQYNVDVNKVISDVFGAAKNRNDLAVQIENGTQYEFFVKYKVNHGVTSSTKGDETLSPPVESIASSYTVGIKAKGEGSNIVFLLEFAKSSGIKPVNFMAATPVNKQNYTKCDTISAAASMDKVTGRLDKCDKHYADNGPVYLDVHPAEGKGPINCYAQMTITGASPAVCMFRIKKGQKPAS